MPRFFRTSQPPQSSSEQNDELLRQLTKAKLGNRQATRALLLASAPFVLRTVRRTLGSQHPDVEDTAQEALLQLHSALPRFEGRSTVIHFICRVALLTAMNVRRRESSAKRLIGGSALLVDEAELPSLSPTPERTAEVKSEMELILEALDVLPGPQAEALGQHCVLGYTSLEIAETEGVSEEVIRSRLRAARRTLRAMLAPEQNRRFAGEDLS